MKPPRSGDEAKLASAKAKNRLQLRRSLARNAGSTYAPDFLGMLKIELIKKWAMYQDAGGARSMPSKIFSSTELVLQDGELTEMDREPGQNNIGMRLGPPGGQKVLRRWLGPLGSRFELV